ncbi:hypothetical protein [Desulfosporosinus sp. Sb-LF]|uniref:hypothetical protein n=1 Tax=Desulfosporosinus sp. Sb-LF TaxID=2560027 RepID=UPI00107EF06B|nr:hypothetical protein [Desulfosporosinus sp. Sb-LF]TGE31132.1 hypothetical protein E4K68_19025 [Desulfosporosinus sp. Sb-LF]
MPIDRSKRLKNMFAAPKSANSSSGDPVAAQSEAPPMEDEIKAHAIPIDLIDEKTDDMFKAEEQNIIQTIPDLDNPLAIENVTKPKAKGKAKPKNDVIKKEKDVEASIFKGPKVYIGCRVSNEMKDALDEMAKDFAYLARKEYGLKIKDDSSSIQRAFLILGMSCFTEKVRHKTLQEYDKESPMQDEVSQQLLALMRIHKVQIDDIDF